MQLFRTPREGDRTPGAGAVPSAFKCGLYDSGPAQRVLDVIAWLQSIGVSAPQQNEAVAFAADSAPTSSGFTNVCGSLRTKGRMQPRHDDVTPEGHGAAHIPDSVLSTEELHRKVHAKLSEPERR